MILSSLLLAILKNKKTPIPTLHDKEPDRTALYQEAKDFEELIAQRRNSSEALYEKF